MDPEDQEGPGARNGDHIRADSLGQKLEELLGETRGLWVLGEGGQRPDATRPSHSPSSSASCTNRSPSSNQIFIFRAGDLQSSRGLWAARLAAQGRAEQGRRGRRRRDTTVGGFGFTRGNTAWEKRRRFLKKEKRKKKSPHNMISPAPWRSRGG